MSETNYSENEKQMLTAVLEKEDLAEKKAKIYSVLLTDPSFAEDMKNVSARHAKRKKTIERLIGEEQAK